MFVFSFYFINKSFLLCCKEYCVFHSLHDPHQEVMMHELSRKRSLEPDMHNDRQEMVVPLRKYSKTIPYSGKPRPESTKGISLHQLCATSCVNGTIYWTCNFTIAFVLSWFYFCAIIAEITAENQQAIKQKWAQTNNVSCVHVWYHEWIACNKSQIVYRNEARNVKECNDIVLKAQMTLYILCMCQRKSDKIKVIFYSQMMTLKKIRK